MGRGQGISGILASRKPTSAYQKMSRIGENFLMAISGLMGQIGQSGAVASFLCNDGVRDADFINQNRVGVM